ncbi:MAG: FAD-binding protein [Candidatus Helarchaeota archaeon]
MSIKIDIKLCDGCGKCIEVCKSGCIHLTGGKAQVIVEKCDLCGKCVEACPIQAITIERGTVEIQKLDFSKYRGVWIIGEHHDNKIQDYVYQIIGKGRDLANKLGVKLSVIILGWNLDDQINELGNYGVDEVYYVKSPILKYYYSELYVDILTELIHKYKPEIVLIASTPIGRDYAPRLAKRLNTGLTADCTGLDIDLENRYLLLQTRPTFGGNIMATIRTPRSRPQMSTIRPGMFKIPPKIKKEVKINVIEKNLDDSNLRIKILDIIKKERKTIDLEEADIIIAGGRGVGSKENFKLIEELAKELNGEVGGSRVAVELGWIDSERQIGQTGKIISPKLYIACGISGAIQHRVGILGSKIIVAINKDPNAPIFEVAHYGIIGDLHKILPAFIREIRRRKAEKSKDRR